MDYSSIHAYSFASHTEIVKFIPVIIVSAIVCYEMYALCMILKEKYDRR